MSPAPKFDFGQAHSTTVCFTPTMDNFERMQALLDELRERDPETHRMLIQELAEKLGYDDMIDVMDDLIARHLKKH